MELFFPCLVVAFLIGVTHIVWELHISRLKSFPGPLFAKLSNLWRLVDVWRGRPELTQKALHRQYGKAVRLGPNFISLSDPSLIKTIYDTKGAYLKSNLYAVNDVMVGRKRTSTIFSTQNNEWHDAQMKFIAKHYTMTSAIAFEPLVDKTVERFVQILNTRFVGRGVCKMDTWLLYYAWDIIGEITFGEPMGFLEEGGDIGGILAASKSASSYFAPISQIPWLDNLLDKNPVYRLGPATYITAVKICLTRINARLQSKAQVASRPKDYLDFYVENMTAEGVSDQQVVSWLMINMIAGSNTVAIALRAVLYFVLKHPYMVRKLQTELDSNLQLPIRFKQAQSLPYLDAVITEAFRLHPSFGMPLERVVPSQGLTLPDGKFIPPGTIVGMNPHIVNSDVNTFGEDADLYRPERWLQEKGERTEEWSERIKRMKEADLTFGAGKRVCRGMWLSKVEIYKTVARLFLQYDMQLEDPEKEWQIENHWLAKQSGIEVRLKRRHG